MQGFAIFANDKPLTIKQGGLCAAIGLEEYKAKIVGMKGRVAGLVAMGGLDMLFNASPHVQIRSGALEQVIEDLFEDPRASEMPFTVSIPVYDIDWEPWSHKSGWPHLNAEHVLGALQATHRDRKDLAKLNQWRKAWRNLQGTFVFLPVEDWSKENLSL